MDKITREYNMSSPRTRKLKKTIQSAQREISTIRGRVYTQIFRDKIDIPLMQRRADAFRALMEEIPINIYDNELIVGGITEKRKGAFLSPETNIEGMSVGGRLNQPVKKVLNYITTSCSKLIYKMDKFLGMQLKSARILFDMKFDNPENRASHRFIIGKQEKLDLDNTIIPYWKNKNAYSIFRFRLSREEKTLMGEFNYLAEHAFGGGVFLFHPNIEKTVQKGLNPIISEVEQYQLIGDKDFYAALGSSLSAVIKFARRYAELAESKINTTQSPARKAELMKIAEICNHVPANPPRTFHEGLQSLWFIYIAVLNDDCGHEIPFGRWDQVLFPLYEEDLKKGRITRSDALELIECFILKINEIEFLLHNGASFFEDGNSGRLTLTIGGVNSYGEDATNEVSYLFLEALSNCRMIQPNPAVRIHKSTPIKFIDLVTEVMCSGANTVQVFNDETIIEGFTKNGIPLHMARNYILSGCVEPIPEATYGSVCAAHLVLPRTLELFLKKKGNYNKYEDFYEAYKVYLSGIIKNTSSTLFIVDQTHKELLPNTFISAITEGPLERGFDVKAGSSEFNLTGISLLGLGTLADSLEVIKKTVFEDQKYTLSTLKRMIKQNFEGYESDRLYLINRIPKYGNDIDEVDFIARDISNFCSDEASKYSTFRNGRYTIGVHSENAHVVLGLVTGATPDGRRQMEPYSIGAGSSRGREKKGYTATLKSVSKLNHNKVISGVSVNLRFNPSLFDTPEKIQRFKNMIIAYFFDYDGQNLQATVVDSATLKLAQQFPNNYQDLIVRISGYSARFIELTKNTQDEIISRTEFNS